MSEPLVLRAAIGRHGHVAALRDGTVASDRLRLDLVEFDPLPKAFRRMVRELDLDVSEMALTTHALAHSFGKPLTALPIPLWSRLHHGNLVCAAGSDIDGPADLVGRKVGVRAYSQTTGVWLRGILQDEHGIEPDSVTWVTMEDAHVAEYQDPPWSVRHRDGKGLRDLLLSGELAAIMGERNVDPGNVRTVIPDAEAAALSWSKRTGVVPVNHVVSVKTDLLDRHPWLAGELTTLFEAARQRAIDSGGGNVLPYGLEPNRRSMQMLLGFMARQKLTAREYQVGELFRMS